MSGSTYFLRRKITVTLHATVVNFLGSSAHKMMIFFFDVVAWPRGWGVPGVRIWVLNRNSFWQDNDQRMSSSIPACNHTRTVSTCKSGQNKASSTVIRTIRHTQCGSQAAEHKSPAREQRIWPQQGVICFKVLQKDSSKTPPHVVISENIGRKFHAFFAQLFPNKSCSWRSKASLPLRREIFWLWQTWNFFCHARNRGRRSERFWRLAHQTT